MELFIVLVFILFACVIATNREIEKENKEKDRQESVIEWARKNGFLYKDELKDFPSHAAFKIRKIGNQNRYTASTSGYKCGLYFNIVDFNFLKYVGRYRGRNWEPVLYSICFISNEGAAFPAFYVRDQVRILDYLGKLLWGQDIDFNDDEIFSDMFVLQGEKEEEIRRLFGPNVRNAFIHNHRDKYIYECCQNTFAVLAPKPLDGYEREELLDQAIAIFNELDFNLIQAKESFNDKKN